MSFRLLLGVLALLAAQATSAAEPATSTAAQAAALAAQSGDYHAAVSDYERVIATGGYSAPALFNLGNAWLRLGKSAPAILAYERALVLAPRDAALRANLATARERAGIAPEAGGAWLNAARTFSFDTYAWTGLGALWVLCAALVLLSLNRMGRTLARVLILGSVMVLCVCADAAVLCWPDLYRAVAQSAAAVHVAPAAAAAATGALREGETVWLGDRYGAFMQVRTADGRSGWVDSAAAVAVRSGLP